jgi:hypothetical protein
LESFAEIFEAVMKSYDTVFGFREYSKVPGKKLRVRVHLEEKITRPPHFAPQFPYHSEIDIPVIDPKTFSSPTPAGQHQFFGLCHELGHVVAMWGNSRREEDHHAWADYTGGVIVEHLSKADPPFMKHIRDAKRTSLETFRTRLKDTKPSREDHDGVLRLFIELHDQIGPKAIGAAINAVDQEDRRLRVNRVRYYTFSELRDGLQKTLTDPEKRRAAAELVK